MQSGDALEGSWTLETNRQEVPPYGQLKSHDPTNLSKTYNVYILGIAGLHYAYFGTLGGFPCFRLTRPPAIGKK